MDFGFGVGNPELLASQNAIDASGDIPPQLRPNGPYPWTTDTVNAVFGGENPSSSQQALLNGLSPAQFNALFGQRTPMIQPPSPTQNVGGPQANPRGWQPNPIEISPGSYANYANDEAQKIMWGNAIKQGAGVGIGNLSPEGLALQNAIDASGTPSIYQSQYALRKPTFDYKNNQDNKSIFNPADIARNVRSQQEQDQARKNNQSPPKIQFPPITGARDFNEMYFGIPNWAGYQIQQLSPPVLPNQYSMGGGN